MNLNSNMRIREKENFSVNRKLHSLVIEKTKKNRVSVKGNVRLPLHNKYKASMRSVSRITVPKNTVKAMDHWKDTRFINVIKNNGLSRKRRFDKLIKKKEQLLTKDNVKTVSLPLIERIKKRL